MFATSAADGRVAAVCRPALPEMLADPETDSVPIHRHPTMSVPPGAYCLNRRTVKMLRQPHRRATAGEIKMEGPGFLRNAVIDQGAAS
jgi:hypothetical protein